MLRIRKNGNQFIAITPNNLGGDKKFGPLTEVTLKKKLFSLGYNQQDIEQAFYQSAPDYFGVGRW